MFPSRLVLASLSCKSSTVCLTRMWIPADCVSRYKSHRIVHSFNSTLTHSSSISCLLLQDRPRNDTRNAYYLPVQYNNRRKLFRSTLTMAPKIKLGYWKIRGLGQPIRLILTYAGAEFSEERYEQGDAPGYSRDAWDKVKYTLGLDFPNLPYLFDGDVNITQSNAIIRYLGAKFNLLGENPKIQAASEMMLENAMDLRNGLVGICYNPNYDSIVDGYFKEVDGKFKQYEAYLGEKNWFAGGKNVTICDFPMYELLDQHRLMRPDSLKAYPKLNAFLARFAALPKIKEYLASDKCIKRPVNNKDAGFK